MAWWGGFIQFLKDFKEIIWFIGIVATVIPAIHKWTLKPLNEIRTSIKELDKKMHSMNEKLSSLDEDTADIIGNRLQESHDFYCYQQKWCTSTEKQRLEDMVHKYHRKGRNHLSDRYLEDIIALPEHPAT